MRTLRRFHLPVAEHILWGSEAGRAAGPKVLVVGNRFEELRKKR